MLRQDRNKLLLDSIRRLLRRGAGPHLRKLVNKIHAADLSIIFRSLPLAHQLRIFDLIEDIEQKGILFSELDEDTFLELVEDMRLEDLAEILENMPADDVADLLGRMPEEKSTAILDKMKQEDSHEVEGLLYYADDTAGGIMVPDFIALREDLAARQAIEAIQQEYQDVEMAFYIYVVDDIGRLVGVSSLRQLVVVPPETPLRDLMTTDVFSVQTHTDQEQVARIVARYDILAVPVVDEANKLLGIVTVDDVIDIIREEATEDILKMAGMGDEFVETKSIPRSIRIRVPWLFASCLGGILASFIIGRFTSSLSHFAFLSAFIPVIMGMGGNIGIQSSTIVVRGLATGRLHIRDIWRVLLKEISVGVLLGLLYGVLIATVAHLQYDKLALAISVMLGVLCSMSLAALSGSLVPMIFARLNIDPAVASGPFVTTAIDIISVSCYLSIATWLLSL